MFYKVKFRGGEFEYLIIEASEDVDWYEGAQEIANDFYGDPTLLPDDNDAEVVENPLQEPWPILTEACFKLMREKRMVKIKNR